MEASRKEKHLFQSLNHAVSLISNNNTKKRQSDNIYLKERGKIEMEVVVIIGHGFVIVPLEGERERERRENQRGLTENRRIRRLQSLV